MLESFTDQGMGKLISISLWNFIAILLFFMATGGRAQLFCNLDQIEVTQTLVNLSSPSSMSTNVFDDIYIGQKTQFHVKVANNCPCSPAAAVTFFCDGFPPDLVSQNVLNVDGARCLLIEGEAIIQVKPVRFDYTFDRQLPLLLESADFTC